MTAAQTIIARNLGVTAGQLATALHTQERHRAALGATYGFTHIDTPHRRKMRALLDGAGLADASVQLTFVKACGGLRHMLCTPCPGSDDTARYVTVRDLELSHETGRTVFRRVCLDTIAAVQIDYRLVPA